MAEQATKVGGRIEQERNKRGWTKAELARRMPGVATGNDVRRWESGQHVPRLDTLEALADLFEIAVSDLHAGPLPEEEDQPQETPDIMAELGGPAESVEDLSRQIAALRHELLSEIGKVRTAQEALRRSQATGARSSATKSK